MIEKAVAKMSGHDTIQLCGACESELQDVLVRRACRRALIDAPSLCLHLRKPHQYLLWALSPHVAGMGTAYIRYSGRASSSYGGSGSCSRTFFANKSATGRENVSR